VSCIVCNKSFIVDFAELTFKGFSLEPVASPRFDAMGAQNEESSFYWIGIHMESNARVRAAVK